MCYGRARAFIYTNNMIRFTFAHEPYNAHRTKMFVRLNQLAFEPLNNKHTKKQTTAKIAYLYIWSPVAQFDSSIFLILAFCVVVFCALSRSLFFGACVCARRELPDFVCREYYYTHQYACILLSSSLSIMWRKLKSKFRTNRQFSW